MLTSGAKTLRSAVCFCIWLCCVFATVFLHLHHVSYMLHQGVLGVFCWQLSEPFDNTSLLTSACKLIEEENRLEVSDHSILNVSCWPSLSRHTCVRKFCAYLVPSVTNIRLWWLKKGRGWDENSVDHKLHLITSASLSYICVKAEMFLFGVFLPSPKIQFNWSLTRFGPFD